MGKALRFLAGVLLLLGSSCIGRAPREAYPEDRWENVGTPEALGWSPQKLGKAEAFAGTIDTAAFMVVHGGRIVLEWGETSRPFNCHSIRKSFLSALYGIHVAAGRIRREATLAELGIDDNDPSLTDVEKKARVADLLKARSGIYHPALYETAGMKARRPKRGSHAPGTFWYYNNWDFNALGTIFEKRTGRSLFLDFEERLAKPLGMKDFERDKHTRYVTGPDSIHPAYPFRLSARDLARFGLLFARGGRWRDGQVISPEWVEESTRSYSKAGSSGGYGYMWWVAEGGRPFPGVSLPDGAFSARGYRGHYLAVVPEWDLVVVHRVDTFTRDKRVTSTQFGRLLALILEASPLAR